MGLQYSNNNYVLKYNIIIGLYCTVYTELFTRVQTISRGEKTVPQNSTAVDYSSINILIYCR